ncbi:MAG TPA: DUF2950 domain-containing protein [Gallionellaceae bacterium]
MASLLERTWWHAQGWHRVRLLVCLFALCGVMSASVAAPAGQKSYASPQAAVAGLLDAVKSNKQAKLGAILGASGNRLIRSGDAVADAQGRASFVKAYGEANRLMFEGDAKAVLIIGKDSWPFPIPLVKDADSWRFDTQQGEQEILDRRIGRNELAAIQVCLAIVDAEREYAASHLDSDGVPEYAARIVSTTGKHDGLYWPDKADEPQSPLGPLIAAAASEGYPPALSPYHGYFYRILTAQGEDAPGGEYAYFIKGKMIGGFAVIAYPARYGASGIKTFMVDHDGAVFEKDLGNDTGALAPKAVKYNPDPSWQRVSLP